ncbi:hypothetical protein CDES_10090 [Corynebacterium deserti GIMN1.010]|uniref:Uncharacterized protein n=1 Tax=Corynebacterium deserti GIMN1.010 TaxID=931089 RepID=A0A0M4CYB5_9CORY|nr:hypothetical protein [Corynebacterium deserti]ALC06400.1 hypothetical protein CDES_10090 [Corynebacterium deserti GIMN1.010]
MAIKLSIDLSEATFAELSAVIGYAHRLGIDPDEKLKFEDGILNLEFDGDLQFDDVFDRFDEAELELDGPELDGPIYAEDLIDDEDIQERRAGAHSKFDDDSVADIKEGVNNFVNGVIDAINGAASQGNRERRGRYGNFGDFGGGFGGPFGPFGPFGPNNRGPRF